MKKTILTLFTLGFLGASSTYAQVGIGTQTPDPSAILELESTEKGFLPPRMTTEQRNAIPNPEIGLVIFNTTDDCIQISKSNGWFNICDGSTFTEPKLGGSFNNGFEGNTTCSSKLISITPCSSVAGTTFNDNINTFDGVEYDWTGAIISGMANTSPTRAVVDIGGQCWMRFNMINAPTSYDPSPTWINDSDLGWNGLYTGGPFLNEGSLYQWSAAMNAASSERAQGICPTGWHIPSDCEWMYLEHSLGMDVTSQQNIANRSSGNIGSKLSGFTSNGLGDNSSGFTGRFAGFRNSANGAFVFRDEGAFWWSSSQSNSSEAYIRELSKLHNGIVRNSRSTAMGYSVRCIKD